MSGNALNPRIGVVGAGAFGTALACVMADADTPVLLFGRDAARMDAINATRLNPRLPGVDLPAAVRPVSDLAALSGCQVLLMATPSAAQAATAGALRDAIGPECDLVMCAKGINQETGTLITQALADAAPGHRLHVLSGPGFAADIAKGLPTAMTLASQTLEEAEAMAATLSRRTFRLYASLDMTGVQYCGALKNVFAIAAGIVIGAGLGESARAALIARGLAELTRFLAATGGLPETAAGLAGLGDLVLTATSLQSRNCRFGMAIGRGEPLDALSAPGQPLVEGVAAAVAASRAAHAAGIEMPVTDAVAAIVTGRLDVDSAVDALLSRPLRIETD